MAVLEGHAQRIPGDPARTRLDEAQDAVHLGLAPRLRDTHGLAEGGGWPATRQPRDGREPQRRGEIRLVDSAGRDGHRLPRSLVLVTRASCRIALSRSRRGYPPAGGTRSACTVSKVPSCSWCGSWRAWAIQPRKLSMPSSRATWLTGTLRDRVTKTTWWRTSAEYGATDGRLIGMGRSTTATAARPGRSVADVLGPRAGTGTGTMRNRAMRSPRPSGVAGALATVHSLGASCQHKNGWHIPRGAH